MKLSEYLAEAGLSATDLAKLAEVEVSTITRAAKGNTIPSRELMAKIVELTKGKVQPNDFFGIAA